MIDITQLSKLIHQALEPFVGRMNTEQNRLLMERTINNIVDIYYPDNDTRAVVERGSLFKDRMNISFQLPETYHMHFPA